LEGVYTPGGAIAPEINFSDGFGDFAAGGGASWFSSMVWDQELEYIPWHPVVTTKGKGGRSCAAEGTYGGSWSWFILSNWWNRWRLRFHLPVEVLVMLVVTLKFS
jgi:hypothetical protein